MPIYYTTLNYRPDEVETGGMVDFKPFDGKLEGQRGLGGGSQQGGEAEEGA